MGNGSDVDSGSTKPSRALAAAAFTSTSSLAGASPLKCEQWH